MKYKVFMEHRIVRAVLVEASSAAEAKQIIKEYGEGEAFNDFAEAQSEGYESVRIIRANPTKR
jgi:hypothetical protein